MRRRPPPAGSQGRRPSPGLRAAWRRRRARGGAGCTTGRRVRHLSSRPCRVPPRAIQPCRRPVRVACRSPKRPSGLHSPLHPLGHACAECRGPELGAGGKVTACVPIVRQNQAAGAAPPVPLHVRWEHGARPSAVRPACHRCQPAVGMPHGGRSASGAGVALCGRARRGGRALRQVDCVAVRVQEEALRCGLPALTCAKSARPQDRAPARRAPCCYRPPTDDRRIPHAGLWQRPHAQGRPAVQAACGIRLQVDSNAAQSQGCECSLPTSGKGNVEGTWPRKYTRHLSISTYLRSPVGHETAGGMPVSSMLAQWSTSGLRP